MNHRHWEALSPFAFKAKPNQTNNFAVAEIIYDLVITESSIESIPLPTKSWPQSSGSSVVKDGRKRNDTCSFTPQRPGAQTKDVTGDSVGSRQTS